MILKIGETKEQIYHYDDISYYGDYACANFLNLYPVKCRILRKEAYPDLLKTEFGISDAALFHHKMIDDGYLIPSSIEERLSDRPLEEIIQIADDHGLPTSGTKEELLQRIDLNCTMKQLSRVLPNEEIYSLSDAGKYYLEAHQEMVDLYQAKGIYSISYEEYEAARKLRPDASFAEILWQVLQTRFQGYVDQAQFKLVQKEYLNMYAFLLNQDRLSEALSALLNCFFMDLNAFTDTYALIQQFKSSGETVPAFLAHAEMPQVHIHPQLVDEIAALKDTYTIKAAEIVSTNNISFYVNKDLFAQILDQIFSKTFMQEETEKKIDERVPTALDHILRSDKI